MVGNIPFPKSASDNKATYSSRILAMERSEGVLGHKDIHVDLKRRNTRYMSQAFLQAFQKLLKNLPKTPTNSKSRATHDLERLLLGVNKGRTGAILVFSGMSTVIGFPWNVCVYSLVSRQD